MEIKKDLQNVIFSFGAVFLSMSVGGYMYYTRDTDSLNARVISEREEVTVDDSIQYELPENVVPTTEDVVPVAGVVVPTTTKPVVEDIGAKSKALLEAEQRAKEKAATDALAQQIAETQAMIDALAKEKATADALAAQLAAEKAAADAAAKKSRKSRAS